MSEIFKTEFRGYNKQDVADYIVSLNSQLEELKAELDLKKTELVRMQAQLNEQSSQEDIEEAVRRRLYPEIELEIKARLEAEAEEKHSQSAENGVYIIREELEMLRQKAQQYDGQKDMLAELMIKARTDAADIYAEAEKSSQKQLAEAREKLACFENDFKEMKRNVLVSKSEMDTRLTNIRHYLDDFVRYLELAETDIENTVDNFNQNVSKVLP